MDINKNSTPDVFILVENFDAINVWAEQIESALGSLVPKVTTAREDVKHLYLKDQYTTCKKLLLILDTKSDIYRSHIVDTWLKHFSSLKPKDIICVLVDSGTTNLSATELGKGRLNVVKTDDIAHFYNWWPTLVEFLFLKTKAAPKVLNYTLEIVHTHEDDQLPRRLTQCLDAFVDPDKTRANKRCQTVKVVGGAGEENPQKRENMHIVLASIRVNRGVYDHCNSVHTRDEVLKCILYILIDSGIVPLSRLSRMEHVTKIRNTCPRMFLLSSLVFVMNLLAALLVSCYACVPLFGTLVTLHLSETPAKLPLWYMVYTNVFFQAPFNIIGSLALTDIIDVNLSTTLIIICFFILPLAYFVGWVTFVHYSVNKRVDCEYGIWSLPSHLWSTDYTLPDCCWWLYLPVFATHLLLFRVIVMVLPASLGILCFPRHRFQMYFSIHILGSEPIIITLVFFGLGFSPYFIVPAGIVGCIYFVSVTRLKKWQEMVDSIIDDLTKDTSKFYIKRTPLRSIRVNHLKKCS